MKRLVRIVLAGSILGACASPQATTTAPPPPPVAWIGGDPAHLAADKADCEKVANQTDVNESGNYSNTNYGVTAAMAAAVGRDNPLTNQAANVRAAMFTTCMNDKGWKAP